MYQYSINTGISLYTVIVYIMCVNRLMAIVWVLHWSVRECSSVMIAYSVLILSVLMEDSVCVSWLMV